MLPSYRNQSIDLHSKSIDWFLYEGNTDTYGLKKLAAVNWMFARACMFFSRNQMLKGYMYKQEPSARSFPKFM